MTDEEREKYLKMVNIIMEVSRMKRFLRILPLFIIMTGMLLSELTGNTNKLIFCGFLFLADVYIITKD